MAKTYHPPPSTYPTPMQNYRQKDQDQDHSQLLLQFSQQSLDTPGGASARAGVGIGAGVGVGLRRMPSAKEVVSSGSYISPLARLEAEGKSARSRANSASAAAGPSSHMNNVYQPPRSLPQRPPVTDPAPVPALELNNLFRASSRYSVDSLSSQFSIDSYNSFDTISQTGTEVGIEDEEEDEPSTPKASTHNQVKSYFEPKDTYGQIAPPTESKEGEGAWSERSRLPSSNSNSTINATSGSHGVLTPKRSFSVTSRRPPPNAKPPLPPSQIYLQQPQAHPHSQARQHQHQDQQASFQLGSIPARSRGRSASDAQAREVSAVHHPESTQIADDLASMHGEQGSDWGDDESQFEWLDTEGAPEAVNGVEGQKGSLSPSKRLSKLKAVMSGGHQSEEKRKLRKPLIIHRRAPPPPANTAPALPHSEPTSPARKYDMLPQPSSFAAMPQPKPTGLPQRAGTLRGQSSADRRPPILSRMTDEPRQSSTRHDVLAPPQAPFAQVGGRRTPAPLMVPLKGDEDAASSPMARPDTRNSHISFQSVAYSFYDLDGDRASPTTPKAEGELAFPHGKYVKVSASTLERERELRERTSSDSSRGSRMEDGGRTPSDFVHAGIEARGKGDLAKSAWYFMKAAEGGSATGRMYWGLALRHGWGVAKDERRAFIELRQACDESLAEGGMDFHRSPGANKLTSQQKKNITKELSVGMFEVGNCFLEGVGVKKAPDVALAYLRFAANMGDIASQEQLGFVLSKGANGVKKDMKEAAKWYRMAISQGSSNTFGLAWVWKVRNAFSTQQSQVSCARDNAY
ncbi:hypothetical protein I317_01027 [Kwoniella heveanensis CBS 569]|nr:hypothetical protein I317_01027 [Kwoniella heveanensis CBS 569]